MSVMELALAFLDIALPCSCRWSTHTLQYFVLHPRGNMYCIVCIASAPKQA
jgi:hypothetical protein